MTQTPDSDHLHQRATAFVFGELSPKAAAEFAEEMKISAELRAIVDSIRDAVQALESEFTVNAVEMNAPQRNVVQETLRGTADQLSPTVGRSTSVAAPPVVLPTTASSESPLTGGTQWRGIGIGVTIAASVILLAALTAPGWLSGGNSATDELAARISELESENSQLRRQREEAERSLASLQATRSPAGDIVARDRTGRDTEEDSIWIDDIAGQKTNGGAGREDFGDGGGNPESVSQEIQASMPEPTSEILDLGQVNRDPGSLFGTDPYAGGGQIQPKVAGGREPRKNSSPGMLGGGGDSEMGGMDAEMGSMGMMGGMEVAGGLNANQPRTLEDLAANSADGMMMGGGLGGGGGGFANGGDFDDMKVAGDEFALVPMLDADALGDQFQNTRDNPFRTVNKSPLSTFSIDVDTASYSKVRMYLQQHGRLPPADSVRIEELINYFDYGYDSPNGDHPFSASMEVASCPWSPEHRLARVGIKGREIKVERPSSNLVFLLDVSGSMRSGKKLPLVIDGLKQLVEQLNENDSVAIVVYAGAAGMVLDSTSGDQKQVITDALSRLKAGGSTNGGQGIELAYQIARDHFIQGGTNRVILCTDGDFNVGVTGTKSLVKLAAENAKGNIFLTVLGYGIGNHNDSMMEQISNKGNGNYAFIDSAAESKKVLVQQMAGTLVTIAKDVKIQVEFNPAEVASYRLIGYANRVMAAKDFENDKKDAGEIGAGHTITALYEIVLADKDPDQPPRAPTKLRYQQQKRLSVYALEGELLTLKLRYKEPEGDKSQLVEYPVKDSGKSFSEADQDFQFAASVAAFGMLLRNSPHKGQSNYDSVEELAMSGATDDPTGYRTEFVSLIKRAKSLAH